MLTLSVELSGGCDGPQRDEVVQVSGGHIDMKDVVVCGYKE